MPKYSSRWSYFQILVNLKKKGIKWSCMWPCRTKRSWSREVHKGIASGWRWIRGTLSYGTCDTSSLNHCEPFFFCFFFVCLAMWDQPLASFSGVLALGPGASSGGPVLVAGAAFCSTAPFRVSLLVILSSLLLSSICRDNQGSIVVTVWESQSLLSLKTVCRLALLLLPSRRHLVPGE